MSAHRNRVNIISNTNAKTNVLEEKQLVNGIKEPTVCIKIDLVAFTNKERLKLRLIEILLQVT